MEGFIEEGRDYSSLLNAAASGRKKITRHKKTEGGKAETKDINFTDIFKETFVKLHVYDY